jgi:Holliday junction resolvasome RuvABC DNA-binding subunit
MKVEMSEYYVTEDGRILYGFFKKNAQQMLDELNDKIGKFYKRSEDDIWRDFIKGIKKQ